PQRRGPRVRVWHRHLPRDREEVGQPLRADVRREDSLEAGPGHAPAHSLTVASRRGYVRVQGEMRYLWRAVDHEGEVLESFVTKTRDKDAALKFIKKAMKRHGRPRTVVTDGLRSYGAAMKDLGNADRQETGRWLNNRAENSHL